MDATIAIEDVFSGNTFDKIFLNFPDPWPKDRHKKHRIINPAFLEKLAETMKPGSAFEIASDHKEYIILILHTMKETPCFKSQFPPPGYLNEIPDRPVTKYELEFIEEGRKIYYLSFVII